MPVSFSAPVLQVNLEVIRKVDTVKPENVFDMWTVFARCADSVPQGRRLENLSWRLLSQIVHYDGRQDDGVSSATSIPRDTIQDAISDDLPRLSTSVESITAEKSIKFTSASAPVVTERSGIQRQDSCATIRWGQVTSDHLEKMVMSILKPKEPLNAPLPDITELFKPISLPPEGPIVPEPRRSSSTTTEASPPKSPERVSVSSHPQAPPITMASSQSPLVRHTVDHGFTPVSLLESTRLLSQASQQSLGAIPNYEGAPPPKHVQPVNANPLLGSPGADSRNDHSLETQKQPVPQIKRKMFQIVGSSEEERSLRSAMASSPAKPNGAKKIASFHQQPVAEIYRNTSAVENDQSETENEDVDESAIDDDGNWSDWEDSMEESGKPSMGEFNFKRVDSSANLTSRRSLITLMLAQNEPPRHRGSTASQPTPHMPLRVRPNLQGPSLAPSSNDSDDAALVMMRANHHPKRSKIDIPRSSAQPILTTTDSTHHQAALSPRTTRRNMLATELTESLRRHLLWERSQKSSTANAVLKRRPTSHDVANLKQYPEQSYMKQDTEVNPSSVDQYREPFTGYHTRGW